MQQLIRELPKGLLKWYQFHKGKKALYVSGGVPECEVLSEALEECGLQVESVSLEELTDSNYDGFVGPYDYIVFAGVMERCKQPAQFLKRLKEMLKPEGTLLFGMDNRLGIRYFCGDRDEFTERNFDSIEDYQRINLTDLEKLEGRAYSKVEAKAFLREAGFKEYRFYSVFPNLTMPQLLYAEDYLPEEQLEVRTWPEYHYPDTVFLEEERLYPTLIQNGLFHIMANGYLVECSLIGEYANVKHVTTSMNRGPENALATVIGRDETVKKLALYPEGVEKLERIYRNDEDLRERGLFVVASQMEDGIYVMPYIRGEVVTNYFKHLMLADREKLFRELDRWWQLVLQSSEHVPYEEIDWECYEPGWEKRKADDPNRYKWKKLALGKEKNVLGPILKKGYIDLVSLNCFLVDGEFVFYDQEFVLENIPARTIMQRSIDLLYLGDGNLEQVYPREQLYERYGIQEYAAFYRKFTEEFLNGLRHDKLLASHYRERRRDIGVVNSNRQRMNYSENEYQRLFRDIFRNTEGRKLYLFGSGQFTKRFLSRFGQDYEIAGILDNNSGKWGEEMDGITIQSPEVLRTLEPWEYKVIICIKNYVPVLKQLQAMGVKEYGIFDRNLEYPRTAKIVASVETKEAPKPYHIGYVAGVFDMFHMGHLNLLRRAKEQCDYLIVGVVSDEAVRRDKKTNPVIPFEERREIVQACRYVDEAVEIPADFGDTDEAYRRYQFDAQFSGSDYADDPVWQAKKTYLQQRGSDLVFFPYTESTSSTKLKDMISKKLL